VLYLTIQFDLGSMTTQALSILRHFKIGCSELIHVSLWFISTSQVLSALLMTFLTLQWLIQERLSRRDSWQYMCFKWSKPCHCESDQSGVTSRRILSSINMLQSML